MPRLILDGYNLLLRSRRGADQGARDELVREAARYRGTRDLDVLVVFDSPAAGASASATPYPGVRVEYAGGDADRAIVEAVRRSRSPRDLLVVTSDRRLAAAVRDLGARAEDGEAFRARAARRASRGAPGEKPEGLGKDEVEEWLEVFRSRRPEEDES